MNEPKYSSFQVDQTPLDEPLSAADFHFLKQKQDRATAPPMTRERLAEEVESIVSEMSASTDLTKAAARLHRQEMASRRISPEDTLASFGQFAGV